MANSETAEQFLYRSFRLLDEGKFDEWLRTCGDNVVMILKSRRDDEWETPVSLINDDVDRLKGRIEQIKRYWHAENPPTKTLHSVTNVECIPLPPNRVLVHSCFTLIATRRSRQDFLYGRYRDILFSAFDGWRLERREALLENDVIERGKISYIV
ncbi:MAG: aromatic-ring-hydroxylating dioxygenase subunit beta [Pseudomonadota bacterium]|nr:aromatic-ring-hydroxylating dioxygenase subunit beta [Pseudomonadota bacterium]